MQLNVQKQSNNINVMDDNKHVMQGKKKKKTSLSLLPTQVSQTQDTKLKHDF